MKVSFLTTVRLIDEFRYQNLQSVVNEISTHFPEWEITVVEQDIEPTNTESMITANVNYLHVYNPEGFNKSWGVNVAFNNSQGDILVICDADILVGKDDLYRAVLACEKELDAVRPYGKLIDMVASETQSYMATGALPCAPEIKQGYDRKHASEKLCFAGGIFIVRREYFIKIGGMDERFSGWGGEDDAMSIKLQGMSDKVAIANQAIAWHLWHPRSNNYGSAAYHENCKLLHAYQYMTKTALAAVCQQSKRIGDVEKFSVKEQCLDISGKQSETELGSSILEHLLPMDYGEMSLTGSVEINRKIGIVITSCGRPDYLKQCLQSLKKSDLTQAVVCIIDESSSSKQNVAGFSCFEGIDSPGLDLDHVSAEFYSLRRAAEDDSRCNLFNEQGWLKSAILPLSEIIISHPRHGLYIKDAYLEGKPGLKQKLSRICSIPDRETAEVIQKFSIPGVPLIKIYKSIHKNMFDSLRVGWDLLENLGCEYLVNLDSDAIVSTNWLNRTLGLHQEFKRKRRSSSFILTGFNSSFHDDTIVKKNYRLKKTVGGINLFFHRSIYQEIVWPTLSDIDWDHRLSELLANRGIPVIATKPSVVQHIGEFGLWSKAWDYDVSNDFDG